MMRKTIGKYVRRYLYDKRLGDRRVVAIYRDGVKIWPTLSDTVYSCVLDVAAVEGTLDWVYWLHALDAVSKLGASAECYMKMMAGGRDYMLGATFGNWYPAVYDGRATVIFGDNGPLWEKLQPGDEVSVQLRVPARECGGMAKVENATAEEVVALPWLPGAGLGFTISKGRKKTNANWEFSVVGQGSGTLHIDGYSRITGHKRGDWATVVYAREMRVHQVLRFSWDDGYAAGDTGVLLRVATYSGGTAVSNCRLLCPGFVKTLRFKVSAVTRHG
ncbi:MAG: hypothetical protein IJ498_08735 [Akkermansia sp.]|nr:hypothetical protein [Akkermansia sp.]